MILEIDNKGAVDLCNNWAVAGRTRHIDVRQLFVRDLKEAGIIKVVWRKGEEQTSDIFTKNLPLNLFEYHGSTLYGKDAHYEKQIILIKERETTKENKKDKKELNKCSQEHQLETQGQGTYNSGRVSDARYSAGSYTR